VLENDENGVGVISIYQSLESDRDSDFDCYSAYSEAIDNSIQADATVINIKFDPSSGNAINKVTFSDNGTGMDTYVLQRCLRLGYSSRFNDRTGIGRFGVGMTKGAIHECRRVDVYSKTSGGEWEYTYLDLDEIKNQDTKDGDNSWRIPPPVKKSPKDTVDENLIPVGKGTIVVWSKYDRAPDRRQNIIDEFRIYIGRVFRHYIWNTNPMNTDPIRAVGPVDINLDGRPVFAIDPLYVNTAKTEFSNDPVSYEYEPIIIDYPILDPELEKQLGKKTSTIKIRLSLLPEEWRKEQGQGNTRQATDRHLPRNEGISLLRHGREVGYDWIPHWNFQPRELDRFWGCEISFEPELDRAFTVKNIKRGAVPSQELKKLIGDKIKPWIRGQRELISEFWAVKSIARPQDPIGGSGHYVGEEIARRTKLPAGKAVKPGDEKLALNQAAVNAAGDDLAQQEIWKERFKQQPFSIKDDSWPGTNFMDISHMGGSDLLIYNTRHQLIDTLRTIQGEVGDGINLAANAIRLVALTDIIFMAFGKSISMIHLDQNLPGRQFKDEVITNWGSFLSSYITSWIKELDKDLANN
jgi:hypothetical protein